MRLALNDNRPSIRAQPSKVKNRFRRNWLCNALMKGNFGNELACISRHIPLEISRSRQQWTRWWRGACVRLSIIQLWALLMEKSFIFIALYKAPQLCNKLNKKRFTKSRLGQIGVTFRTIREPRRELIDLLSDCGKIDAVLDDVSFLVSGEVKSKCHWRTTCERCDVCWHGPGDRFLN